MTVKLFHLSNFIYEVFKNFVNAFVNLVDFLLNLNKPKNQKKNFQIDKMTLTSANFSDVSLLYRRYNDWNLLLLLHKRVYVSVDVSVLSSILCSNNVLVSCVLSTISSSSKLLHDGILNSF